MTDFTAPRGSPGIPPRWTSSAKSAVGTAARAESRIWFTISHGILNEIYAPRLDSACIRDFGFIVTANGYFSEEKRATHQTVEMIEDGVPAFRLVNTSINGRYRITKTVFSDPLREVVLQQIHFEALVGTLVRLSASCHRRAASGQSRALITPAWCGNFKGHGDAVCRGPGTLAGGGVVGAMAGAFGRLCRNFRWLADAVARPRLAGGIQPGAKTAMSPSPERSIWPRMMGGPCSRSVSARCLRKRGCARCSACNTTRSRSNIIAWAGVKSRPNFCRSTNPAMPAD